MVSAYEKASTTKIPYKIVSRRAGDIAKCFADASLAEKVLQWKAKRSLNEMCEDSFKWQSNNPNGYASK